MFRERRSSDGTISEIWACKCKRKSCPTQAINSVHDKIQWYTPVFCDTSLTVILSNLITTGTNTNGRWSWPHVLHISTITPHIISHAKAKKQNKNTHPCKILRRNNARKKKQIIKSLSRMFPRTGAHQSEPAATSKNAAPPNWTITIHLPGRRKTWYFTHPESMPILYLSFLAVCSNCAGQSGPLCIWYSYLPDPRPCQFVLSIWVDSPC